MHGDLRTLRLASILAGIALLFILGAYGPAPALAESASQVKARKHPSYQVFAAKLKLPAIAVLEPNTIQVGGQIRFELTNLAQLPIAQRQAMAEVLEVPPAVVNQFFSSQDGNLSEVGAAANFAAQLRATVVDHHFLQDWWTRFSPPPQWQTLKSEALESLQAGQLAKVWELYLTLLRPAPPKNLRAE